MKPLWLLAGILIGLKCPAVLAQPGLQGEYFKGTNFEQKVFTRVDPQIAFSWTGRSPGPGLGESYFSVRWTGKLRAPATGRYDFSATVDDGIRVWVGNKKIIDAWALHDDENFRGSILLKAGAYYDLRVEYFNDMLEGVINLVWHRPDDTSTVPPLVDAAGKIIGDPTTYHTIEGQFLYRTVPPPPKPVRPVVAPPKSVAKPVVVAPAPVRKPTTLPAKPVPRPVAVATPPTSVSPSPSAKRPAPETFEHLEVGKTLVLKTVFLSKAHTYYCRSRSLNWINWSEHYSKIPACTSRLRDIPTTWAIPG